MLGTRRVRRARSSSVVERGSFYGVQFHPEKSSARRPARCSRNFARAVREGAARVILYPAIDILDGSAVRLRQGRLRRRRPSTTTTRSPPRARGCEAGAALPARRRPRRRAAPASRSTLEHLRADRRARPACPVQYGGGLRTRRGGRGTRCAAGAERVVLGTAAFTRPRLPRRRRSPSTGRERVRRVGRRARRPRRRPHGWTRGHRAAAPPRRSIALLRAAACARFVYTNIDHDGMLDGPDLDEVERGRARSCAGAVLYSGGIGTLDDLRRAARPARRSTSVGRDRRQGAVRAALHGREAQAALARAGPPAD